ncbi:heme-degrading monooxygenase HmoA [Rhizomicrobium palustre]|uniref:Heme-degrading monooxygenase HmoA n=1 Tax=Rhizomicrobium palustre TaxID=189966 RepID=A0A846N2L0_9PROT|nr:antibiotic biosynthesis monooxygenase [Rhizomicrobium palustre]NIK89541.1 heme-degrading monooxygenase HmoA [Rhizomicrobium palustre]
MIVRVWTGDALEENAEEYRRQFAEVYLRRFKAIKGFHGVQVLERVHHNHIEFVIISRWDSMDAIHEYTGERADHAVLEKETREALARYDEKVKHYVLVLEENR